MKQMLAFFLVFIAILFVLGCAQKQPEKPSVPIQPAQPITPPPSQQTQDSIEKVGESINAASEEEKDLTMDGMDDLDKTLSGIEKI